MPANLQVTLDAAETARLARQKTLAAVHASVTSGGNAHLRRQGETCVFVLYRRTHFISSGRCNRCWPMRVAVGVGVWVGRTCPVAVAVAVEVLVGRT